MRGGAARGHDAATLLRANRRGIGLISFAMASFLVNDALIKRVSESLPAAQTICLRGVMATALVLAVARYTGATRQLREAAHGRVVARAMIDAAGSLMYLVALFHMPIANATAINLASPLFVTLLAIVFLGERVGVHRWAAMIAGFLGVTLVVQPSTEGFNAFALLCLLSTVLHATRDLLTRRIAASTPSVLITLTNAAAVTAVAGLGSLVEGWRPVGLRELAMLVLSSVFVVGGYVSMVSALRHGEFSVIAPFRYTGVVYALVLGFLVWGDVPNALTWTGIGLLVGSGMYVLHRERMRAREAQRSRER